MNFLNSIFLTLIVIGPVILIMGIIMLKFPPKKMNYIYGYRTKSSMQNQEKWKFAQKYSARKMVFFGVVLTLLSIVGLFVSISMLIDVIIGLVLFIGAIVIIIVRTERALKKM